jgi:hypothetical protein
MRVRHLVFSVQRELMQFIVKENKEVWYSDRKWAAMIRILPPQKDILVKISQSRNRVPQAIATLFKFSDEETKEYEAAKDEKDLSEIIIRDAKLKGCILIKNEEVKDG